MSLRAHHPPLPGAAPAVKKGGALPPPSSPSRGAPGEAVTRGAQPRYACRNGPGESVPTRVQYGFPAKAPTTAARGCAL